MDTPSLSLGSSIFQILESTQVTRGFCLIQWDLDRAQDSGVLACSQVSLCIWSVAHTWSSKGLVHTERALNFPVITQVNKTSCFLSSPCWILLIYNLSLVPHSDFAGVPKYP